MERKPDNDHLLLQGLKRGDDAAFDHLFRAYFTGMSRYANSIIKDPQSAEDIAQECLETLWRRRKNLPDIQSINAYLYRSVLLQCYKWMKGRKFSPSPAESDAHEPPVLQAIVASETARKLYNLLDTLPKSQQEVIRLHYLEEKSTREIATLLDIAVDSVRKQRTRALLALRKAIIPFS